MGALEVEPYVCRCPHLKSIRTKRVRNVVPHHRSDICEACVPELSPRAGSSTSTKADRTKSSGDNDDADATANDPSASESLWICLTCGLCYCGRTSPGQHALRHFEDDKHSLCINVETLNVWCYACDDYVSPNDLDSLLSRSQRGESDDELTEEFIASVGTLRSAVDAVEKLLAKRKKAAAQASVQRRTSKGRLKNRGSASTVATDAVTPEVEQVPDGKSGGVCGLQNLGNTCFFNSTLQCLLNSSVMRTLLNTEALAFNVSGSVFIGLRSLLDSYDGGCTTAKKKVLNPISVLNAVCTIAPRFRGRAQQDAQELLRQLLTGLHLDVVKVPAGKSPWYDQATEPRDLKNAHSVVTDAFGGTLVSSLVCHTCGSISTTGEDFMDLTLSLPLPRGRAEPRVTSKKKKKKGKRANSIVQEEADSVAEALTELDIGIPEEDVLPGVGHVQLFEDSVSAIRHCIPSGMTVEGQLLDYMKPETLSGDNRVACEKCTKRVAGSAQPPEESSEDGSPSGETPKSVYSVMTKKYFLATAPKCLTIHVNRFLQSGTGILRKNDASIAFPLTLTLEPHLLSTYLNCVRSDGEPTLSTVLEDSLSESLRSRMSASEDDTYEYDLGGVVVHSGSMRGGHYISYVKSMADGGWYYCSDSMTRPCTEQEVLRSQAYLLLYTQRAAET